MSCSDSGVNRPAKRYISSRQVQKLSARSDPRSAIPAIARWKEWEWILGIPGRTSSLMGEF